jgi:DNA-binding LacI/PurR family transcriptional regulator
MFLIALARGIQRVLTQHGYNLLLNPVGVAHERESLLRRWAHSRAVDGAIVVGDPDVSVEWLQKLVTQKTFCVVIVHHPPPPLPNVGCVTLDLSRGIAQVAELLCSLGTLPGRLYRQYRAGPCAAHAASADRSAGWVHSFGTGGLCRAHA